MKWKNFLFLAAGLAIGLILGMAVFISTPSKSSAEKISPPATGKPMADFELVDLNGKVHRLSDFRGKPVVLNFWATWCPPCNEEMPVFEAYHKQLGDEVVFIGINYMEDVATVQNFVEANQITFQVLLDPAGKASDKYYVQAYPTTFFIDKDGVLRAQRIGVLTPRMLENYLRAVEITP
ncbi:TlpA family protein disulfide reductase [Anaerolinea thermophila]|uniref:Thiol-disulfide oxidoreductase n=1 Tax=Anaerolinea thermophila (strain DSM 14523 / JCM 11388 / NBRC 100420 / UNI-1) TaxID=926569 RepID=E8N610_ANATU|nr:TlpA disulfide reductase family protein [Anaerolinea thermophila]BAJ63874.1 thiol-disulfide oxidoreductase [Anaerolinea thermophila UNI-1]